MTTISWNFKSAKFATTPMMSLETLRDAAVAHYKLEGEFGLRKAASLASKKPSPLLDSSLSVRLANFAQGQKLDLVRLRDPAAGDDAGVVSSGAAGGHKKVLVNVAVKVTSLPESFSESLKHSFSPSTTVAQMLQHFESKSGISFQRELAITEADGSKVDPTSMIRQGTYNVAFGDTPDNGGATAAKPSVRVYNPASDPAAAASSASSSTSDSESYEPTAAHAQAYIQVIRKQGGNGVMLTEKLRDQQKQKRIAELGSVKIRLKFPDGVYVETQYSKTDTVQSMIDTVNSVLSAPPVEFTLYQTYPRKPLQPSQTLMNDLGFLTNTLVSVEFPKIDKFDSKQVLNGSVAIEKPEKRVEKAEEEEGATKGGVPKKKSTKSTGVPKWLKLGKK